MVQCLGEQGSTTCGEAGHLDYVRELPTSGLGQGTANALGREANKWNVPSHVGVPHMYSRTLIIIIASSVHGKQHIGLIYAMNTYI